MIYEFGSKSRAIFAVRMKCHHVKSSADLPSRMLIQEQGGTRYLISACSTCAEIALRSAGVWNGK